MTEQPKRGAGSKILRDRAMAVLRDTRAKMDPQFLTAMKNHFSDIMSSGFATAPPEKGQKQETSNAQKPSFSEVMRAQAKEETVMEKQPVPSYPTQSFDNLPDVKNDGGTEPVDQQKIAKIVLEYMKNRQDGQRH